MKRIGIFLALTLALANQAMAADLGRSDSYTGAPDYRAAVWGGPNIALFFGGEIDSVSLSNTDIGLGPKGVIAGGRVGYDFALGKTGLFVGPVVEAEWSGVSADFDSGSLDQQYRYGGGVKLMTTFDRTGFYILPEYVISHARIDGADWNKDVPGWRFAGGVTQQIANGWSVGGEVGWTRWHDVGLNGVEAKTDGVDFRLIVGKQF